MSEEIKQRILKDVESNSSKYISISHEIHDHPEIGNEEILASNLLTQLLISEGFYVEKNVAGHPTGFIAKKESSHLSGPTIGFLAEYDALPKLGHACGHNIIGVSSAAAAIALGKVLDETGGKVVVLGTPAEEGGNNGSAKGSFVKHNLLKGIDACLMVHPGNKTYTTGKSLAVNPLDFEFIGKSAHASAAPEKGINALDGVILLFNGINALRQHVTSDVRIHGIITHGGDAPNIIPEYAKARFFIRADTKIKCDKVTQRIKGIANGAALATGAKVNIIEFQNSVDNILPNKKFDDVFKEIWESFGLDIHSPENKASGSSDVGNISHVVPTIQPSVKIGPDNLVGHTIEFREAARSKDGDRALLLGAKTLALTGLKLILNKKLLKEIKDEFEYQLKNEANEF